MVIIQAIASLSLTVKHQKSVEKFNQILTAFTFLIAWFSKTSLKLLQRQSSLKVNIKLISAVTLLISMVRAIYFDQLFWILETQYP